MPSSESAPPGAEGAVVPPPSWRAKAPLCHGGEGPIVSWPALCRPSTTGGAGGGKVVDGRARPGHDTRATTMPYAHYFNADAAVARSPAGKSVAAATGAGDGPTRHCKRSEAILR